MTLMERQGGSRGGNGSGKKTREGRAALRATGERGGGDGGVTGDGEMRKKGGWQRRYRENKREGKAVSGRAVALLTSERMR
ncbi:hypothetical protein TIFTF001_018802 [Ficus carica]|uniref:Uncharacterized protein n=1 Tax=Ficus carica TaxID=3494 RepID=A0AA88A558_FICCA|nr:hypothetical protein TIFTF001_018802 [Ficus carica]